MNDIYREKASDEVLAGLVVDVAEESLERASRLLAGINRGMYKAVGSALSRAAAVGKTVAKRETVKEYAISQSEFLSQLRQVNHFTRESNGEISVAFAFRGYVIPLLKFNTRIGSDGRLATQVRRSSSGESLEHAFIAQMGSHRGVYERIGLKRKPVQELYGPSAVQMMYANEEVMDAVENRMVETYQQRLDHEFLRILNGWGK